MFEESVPVSTSVQIPRPAPVAMDFLKEEQKQRRTEIENMLARIENDQRYALIITGAVWSWFAAHQNEIKAPLLYLMFFLPTILTIFFSWRWWNLHRCIRVVADYTKKLEALFEVPGEYGWERWLDIHNETEAPRGTLTKVSLAFWVGLFSANLLIGITLMFFPVPK